MAYGTIPPPAPPTTSLPILSYRLPDERTMTLFPLTVGEHDVPDGLAGYLGGVFNSELAEGKTYPQTGPLSIDQFTAYFFAATTIVGIISLEPSSALSLPSPGSEAGGKDPDGPERVTGERADLESVRRGRKWEDCIGGCYYIKPNYPGRASHNCNAGFLVPPTARGLKIGMTLGKSYLIYAQLLGYRGSVFNLVFKNNVASLAIWDRLGFSRVGLIPKAGRLKSGPNGEEEYVDAVVVWKDLTTE